MTKELINVKSIETALKKSAREWDGKWGKAFRREHDGEPVFWFTNAHYACMVPGCTGIGEELLTDATEPDFERIIPKGEFNGDVIHKKDVLKWEREHKFADCNKNHCAYPITDGENVRHWFNTEYLTLAFRVFDADALQIDLPAGKQLAPALITHRSGGIFVISPLRVRDEAAAMKRPGFDIPGKAELIASMPENGRKFAAKMIDAIETGRCQAGYSLAAYGAPIAAKMGLDSPTFKAILDKVFEAADAAEAKDVKAEPCEEKRTEEAAPEESANPEGKADTPEIEAETPAAPEEGRVYYIHRSYDKSENPTFITYGPDDELYLTREAAENYVKNSAWGFVRFATEEEYINFALPGHIRQMKAALEAKRPDLGRIYWMLYKGHMDGDSPGFDRKIFALAFEKITGVNLGTTDAGKRAALTGHFGAEWAEMQISVELEEEARKQAKINPRELKKGWVYYNMRSSKGEVYSCRDPYGPNSLYVTEAYASYCIRLHDGFIGFISKNTYDGNKLADAFARMEPFFEAENIREIRRWINNNANIYSIKAFGELSGLKMERSAKRRMEQLAEYYGEKWDRMLADEAAESAAKEAAEKEKDDAEKREYLAGVLAKIDAVEPISGREFVDICDSRGVGFPLRTRGFCLNTLNHINVKKGTYNVRTTKTNKNPRSEWLGDVWCKLLDILKKERQGKERAETPQETPKGPGEYKDMGGEEKPQEAANTDESAAISPDWAKLYDENDLDALEAVLIAAGAADRFVVAIVTAAMYRLAALYWEKLAEAGLWQEKRDEERAAA